MEHIMSKQWTIEDVIYIAGYFDGEGCITIHNHCSICVQLTNTYLPTLKWIQQLFDGCIYNHSSHKKGYKYSYKWQTAGFNAFYFLSAISIYLKEKKQQADLAIQFYDTCDSVKYHNGVPDNLKQLRHDIELKLQQLKKVEY